MAAYREEDMPIYLLKLALLMDGENKSSRLIELCDYAARVGQKPV